ncbi:unnamed protein product [Symbiodinium microadriaticum]|nr:unnamed protein product [Symbiodinium microadriaticum]
MADYGPLWRVRKSQAQQEPDIDFRQKDGRSCGFWVFAYLEREWRQFLAEAPQAVDLDLRFNREKCATQPTALDKLLIAVSGTRNVACRSNAGSGKDTYEGQLRDADPFGHQCANEHPRGLVYGVVGITKGGISLGGA